MIDKWEHAQRLGFDAIELRGAGDLAFVARLSDLKAAAAAGVPMPTVCVELLHFVGDFDADKRADALRQLTSQLSVMAEIGGRLAMTPASYGMFSTRLPPFVSPGRKPKIMTSWCRGCLSHLSQRWSQPRPETRSGRKTMRSTGCRAST